jgi:hypothetical protein
LKRQVRELVPELEQLELALVFRQLARELLVPDQQQRCPRLRFRQ